MATATVPSAPQLTGKSLLGKVALAMKARAEARGGRPSRVAALVGDNLLTACALGAGVAAAFLHGDTWGLCSLVPALVVLDFKVRG